MLLTQYLHQLGKECDLSAVISVSSPWDPFTSRKNIEDVVINRMLYTRVIVKKMKAILKRHVGHVVVSRVIS